MTQSQGGAAAPSVIALSGEELQPVDLDGPVERPFTPFPEAWLERPVFAIFSEIAAAHPEKTAVDDGERFLTYREAQEAALKLARRIAASVAPGQPIGIAVPNGATYPIAMLAALAAGRPYVPLDLSFPEARNRLILTQSGMKAVIVDERTRDALAHMDPALPQLDFAGEDDGAGGPALSPSPDDFAFVTYTSGSTGQPKGAYFNQRGLLHDAMRRINASHITPADRLALIFAPTVRAAQEDIYGALLSGATMFVVDLRTKGLQELIRTLRRGRITICFSVPFVFRRLLELCQDPKVFETIRLYSLAGDRVFAADVERFRERFPPTSRFAVGVGSTETNFYTHWFIPRERALPDAMVPVGYVPPGYQVALVDEQNRPVPRGTPGEFIVSGRYIALGYWNDPALTARAFSVSPDDPSVRVFRIGDLGLMQPDGLLELIGRKDRQIKIRGNRIEPAEVEGAVRRHPAVSDCVVIPRSEGEKVELVAYVVKAAASDLSRSALAAWLAEKLPDFMRPRELYFVSELPMLGNFKHDVMALRELDRRRLEEGEPDAPEAEAAAEANSGVAEAVHAAWGRLLGAEALAKDASWELAGGDSAAGMELIFELEERLGRRIGMKVLGPGTRPSDLIARLEPGAASTAERQRRRLFLLPGLLGPILNVMRFAQSLEDEFEVRVLDFLPIDPANPQPVDLDAVVADLIDQIRTASGVGAPVTLLGYSLGGLLAYETARAMSAAGYDIEFLGIIDYSPVAWSTAWHELGSESLLRRMARAALGGGRRQTSLARFLQRFLERQLHHGRYGLLGFVWRSANALGLRRACHNLRSTLTLYLRAKAVERYPVRPYAGRIDLFRAENPAWVDNKLPDDLGWRKFCPEVVVWPIHGGHEDVFQPQYLAETRAAVMAALRAQAAVE